MLINTEFEVEKLKNLNIKLKVLELEYAKILKAKNKTIEEISKTKDHLRHICYDKKYKNNRSDIQQKDLEKELLSLGIER